MSAAKTGSSKRKVRLDIDLHADLTGFGSARSVTPAHRRLARSYSSPLIFGPNETMPISSDW